MNHFLWILLIMRSSSLALDDEVIQFLTDNKVKYLTLVTSNHTNHGRKVMTSSMARTVPVIDFEAEYSFELDFVVFAATITDLPHMLELVTKTKRKSSLLALEVHPTKDADIQHLVKDLMMEMSVNSLFYLTFKAQSGLREWYYVLTIQNVAQVVMQRLAFVKSTFTIVESYNLEGLKIPSLSLSWHPHIRLENCTKEGKDCHTTGAMMDRLAILAKKNNFSFVSEKEVEDNWGAEPVSGPFNLSGEWGGVMGGVISGQYAISLSIWEVFEERSRVLDMIPTTSTYVQMVLQPKPAVVDPGLFIRPFRSDAWLGIGLVLMVIMVLASLCYLFYNVFEQTNAFLIMNFVAWTFFVIVNAYYGGAMTMYFSSSPKIDIQNVVDAIDAYPGWNLIVLEGYQGFFENLARSNAKYLPLVDRMRDKTSETVMATPAEAIHRVKETRSVFFIEKYILQSYLNENPHLIANLQHLGRQKSTFMALPFTKNSPLVPMFNLEFIRFRESGVNAKIEKLWIGDALRGVPPSDVIILSAGQLIMAYILVITGLFVSLFIFTCEIGLKKLMSS